jgi:hypothetical protein
MLDQLAHQVPLIGAMTTRNFEEEPRRLDEILAAEQELFDRIWYDRSMLHEQKAIDAGDDADLEHLRKVAGPGRARVEQTYGIENLGPYDKSSGECSTGSFRRCAGC